MVLQKVPKHSCGKYYTSKGNITGSLERRMHNLGELYHCQKCRVYNFDGREFKSRAEVNDYAKRNRDAIIKNLHFAENQIFS